MPIYDNQCVSCRNIFEWFAHTRDKKDPACPECGGVTERTISRFGIVWTGPITERYLDKDKEIKTPGHWAWERNSTPDGKPRPVFIETWSQQKDFCKREKCARPSELPRNMEVSENGKDIKNGVGMPGCEV